MHVWCPLNLAVVARNAVSGLSLLLISTVTFTEMEKLPYWHQPIFNAF